MCYAKLLLYGAHSVIPNNKLDFIERLSAARCSQTDWHCKSHSKRRYYQYIPRLSNSRNLKLHVTRSYSRHWFGNEWSPNENRKSKSFCDLELGDLIAESTDAFSVVY
jgi:hypothetical protein